MKSLIAPLAALALLAAAGAAMAAPPAYCALYAREYANQFALAAGEKPDSEPKIQDEAYYRCLNMDQEPEMPSTSAYYGTSVDTGAEGGPLEPVAATAAPATAKTAPRRCQTAPPADSVAAAPAATAPPKPATKTADSTPSTHSYTGGKKPWSPEWLAACRKYFPQFLQREGRHHPALRHQPARILQISGRACPARASCRRSSPW